MKLYVGCNLYLFVVKKFLSVSIRYCSNSPQAIHISPVYNDHVFFVQKTETLLPPILGQIYPDIHLYSCQTTLLSHFRNYRPIMKLVFVKRTRTRNGKGAKFLVKSEKVEDTFSWSSAAQDTVKERNGKREKYHVQQLQEKSTSCLL